MILTLDLGTTVTKAAVWCDDGMVALAEVTLTTEHPAPRRAEQDPTQWWASVVDACGALARQVPGGLGAVVAVGCTGARQTFGLFDGAGQPVGPGLLWSDRRDRADDTDVDAPAADQPEPWSVPAKLAWVSAHRRDDVERAAWALAPRDLVVWRLTGRAVTDPTLASCTGLYDGAGHVVGADDAVASLLPPVVPSGEVTGDLTADAAEALGLPRRIPVVIGAGDRACEVLGCGAGPTAPMVSWGTTANVSVPLADRPEEGPSGLSVTRGADGGWLVEGGLSAAGSLLAWLGAVCGRAPDELVTLAGTCPPGARGVVAVPWLGGARAPWWRTDAGAALVGLDAHHGPAELARAVFEAVGRDVDRCLVAAAPASGSPPTGLHLTGVGASTEVWRQVVSGITGLRVDWRRSGQGASAGAALLAAGAVGFDWTVDGLDPVTGEVAPDPGLVACYAGLRPVADEVAAAMIALADRRGGGATA